MENIFYTAVGLISSKGIAIPKEYNICHQYKTFHKDQFSVFEGKLRED
jgi:hypothetical protein